MSHTAKAMVKTPVQVVGIIYRHAGKDYWHKFAGKVDLYAGDHAATLAGEFTITKSGEIHDTRPAKAKKGKKR